MTIVQLLRYLLQRVPLSLEQAGQLSGLLVAVAALRVGLAYLLVFFDEYRQPIAWR